LIERRPLLQWLMLAVILYFSLDLLNLVLGRPIVSPFVREAYATANPFWLLVALLVAAPLFEETFFRGFLFAGLQPSFIGPVGTVVLTSVGWGLLHTQYDAFDVATIIGFGLLLGWARLRSRSLLVPLGIHALTNLVAVVEAAIL
jgi:membrane protease YdiL (CAAX protease family)